jgi:hypothetical protein
LQAPGLTKVGRGVCHDRLGAVTDLYLGRK